jgi:hypothetical protein
MVCLPVLAIFLPGKCPESSEIFGKFHHKEGTLAQSFPRSLEDSTTGEGLSLEIVRDLWKLRYREENLFPGQGKFNH